VPRRDLAAHLVLQNALFLFTCSSDNSLPHSPQRLTWFEFDCFDIAGFDGPDFVVLGAGE